MLLGRSAMTGAARLSSKPSTQTRQPDGTRIEFLAFHDLAHGRDQRHCAGEVAPPGRARQCFLGGGKPDGGEGLLSGRRSAHHDFFQRCVFAHQHVQPERRVQQPFAADDAGGLCAGWRADVDEQQRHAPVLASQPAYSQGPAIALPVTFCRQFGGDDGAAPPGRDTGYRLGGNPCRATCR